MTHATPPPSDQQPADAVALSGNWGDYMQEVSAGGGRFRVTYRGGVPEIEKLTPRGQGTGVGVLEGPLTTPDPRWNEARKVICEGTEFGEMRPGNSFKFGSARCASGEFKGASADPVVGGRDAKAMAMLFGGLFLTQYSEGMRPQASRPVWLEAETYVAPAGDKLKVILRLINSGTEDIVVESPERWQGIYNSMGAGSTVLGGGAYIDAGHNFSFDRIGGSALAPGQSFPDGRWVIPAGQSQEAVFLVYPDGPFSAGTYIAGGRLDFLHVLAPDGLKGSVEMWLRNTPGNRFERDYPANDADLSLLEAARRQREAPLPALAIGTRVTEGGWYRAVRNVSGKEQRSAAPRVFHTGDALPAEEVMTLTGNQQQDLGAATGWRWEAYLQAQMTGHPRERCPRSGLWVPTLPADAPAYLSAQVQPMRMEAGQPMLGIGLPDAAMESRVVWTWIGDGASP